MRGLGEEGGEEGCPELAGLLQQAAVERQLVEVGGELVGSLREEEVSNEGKGKVVVRRGLHL